MTGTLYINAASSSGTPAADIRELIPAPEMRRRMSRILKMAVGAAMECLAQIPEGEKTDAIITATGLGCLADSEKFLRNVIDNGERLLNPTPFIQSTFNTVGAAVALLTGNHCYNMTYTHRGASFGSAMTDAAIRIGLDGARNVLVGGFDESTPSQSRIMERMGAWRGVKEGEGAHFFVVSREPFAGCLARLEFAGFGDPAAGVRETLEEFGLSPDDTETIWSDGVQACYHTGAAGVLYEGVRAIGRGAAGVLVRYRYRNEAPFIMVLKCLHG